jgi:probable rRNA maturation factor
MIQLFFEDVPETHIDQSIICLIELLITEEKMKMGDISFIYCSDSYILKLNNDYLGHDYFTDVITFDYCENSIISGDIFISLHTIDDNAKQYDVSFEKELYRVMVHGVLHLLGYKDKTKEEQMQMREKENFYLDKLSQIIDN